MGTSAQQKNVATYDAVRADPKERLLPLGTYVQNLILAGKSEDATAEDRKFIDQQRLTIVAMLNDLKVPVGNDMPLEQLETQIKLLAAAPSP